MDHEETRQQVNGWIISWFGGTHATHDTVIRYDPPAVEVTEPDGTVRVVENHDGVFPVECPIGSTVRPLRD